MKKKIIRNNVILLIVTIVIVLIVTFAMLSQERMATAKQGLSDWGTLVSSYYNGTNETDTIALLENVEQTIRISFINSDGVHYADNMEVTLSNPLSLVAFTSLGEVQMEMLEDFQYWLMIAFQEEMDNYVLVMMPRPNQLSLLENLVLFTILFYVAVITLMVVLVTKITDVSMKPLQQTVIQLASIIGNPSIQPKNNEIELIALEINQIKDLLQQKVTEVETEKEKLTFILDNMQQGLLVINSRREIVLLNRFARELFGYEQERIMGKDFLYLTRNESLHRAIEETMRNHATQLFDVVIDDRIFSFKLIGIDNSWLTRGFGQNGVLITIQDVTQKRLLDESKRDFFANASHELKSPLTSIIGFQEMIVEKVIQNPDDILELSKRTLHEAKKTTSLINEMLSLSRLETQNYRFLEEDVPLHRLIEEVLQTLDPQIQQLNLTIEKKIEEIQYHANKGHMLDLLKNIIENAVKYNKQSGSIYIELKKENDIVILVKDSGIGIQKEEQQRIFERFYRIDKGRSKKIDGTGLGLAIVKHIVVLYKGTIRLESTLHKGSTFVICLPKQKNPT